MAGKTLQKQEANTELDMFSNERPDHIGEGHRGSEEVGTNDTSLPRLEIIQDLSPQRKRSEAAYIEGAEEGMIFNTASQQLLGGEVILIPVYFRKEWLLWQDRQKSGGEGGFGGAYASEAEAQAALELLDKQENWDIIDTHQHFCMLVNADKSVTEVVLSMSKTKMKPSRQWNTMVQTAGGDRFSRAYRLSVVQVKNAKGSFFNWNVKQLGFVPKELFEKAEFLYDAIKGGQRDVNRNYDAAPKDDANDM